jgi:hypothetical protein
MNNSNRPTLTSFLPHIVTSVGKGDKRPQKLTITACRFGESFPFEGKYTPYVDFQGMKCYMHETVDFLLYQETIVDYVGRVVVASTARTDNDRASAILPDEWKPKVVATFPECYAFEDPTFAKFPAAGICGEDDGEKKFSLSMVVTEDG